jgi:GTP cyclohydrolase I
MVSISVGEKIMTDLMSEIIKTRLKADGKRYFAADNISEYILDDYERQQLIDELASKFQGVLSSLIIDTDNDPNSEGTANRLAKMYC